MSSTGVLASGAMASDSVPIIVAEDGGVGRTVPSLESVPKGAPALECLVRQTVIRLKRRIEDSPSKILLVSCKRPKTDGNVEEEPGSNGQSTVSDTAGDDAKEAYTQVLRLVGTVPESEADNNNIASTVKSVLATQPLLPKVAFRRNVKANSSKITQKSRERFKRGTEESRFKIVSSRRGVEASSDLTDDAERKRARGWNDGGNLLKLLDLVPESSLSEPRKRNKPAGFEPGNVTCNGLPMVKENDDEKGFVYDLYLANDPCIDEFTFGHCLSVEEGDDDAFMDYRDNADDNEKFVDDDEDSNAEDNWRNDYPDSEGEEGELQGGSYGDGAAGNSYNGTGEVYGMSFKGLNMNGESSSDDECIYGIEDDGADYGINNFDASYARYKNKIRKYEQDYEDEVVSISSDSD